MSWELFAVIGVRPRVGSFGFSRRLCPGGEVARCPEDQATLTRLESLT